MKTKFDFKLNAVTLALALSAVGFVSGCGVRGKPLPPEKPAELGRGQPSFKRATEEFAFPEVPSPTPAPDPKNRQESR